MKRTRNALKIAKIIPLILFFIFFVASCHNNVGSNKSHTMLVISKLTGKTATGEDANFVESDVVKINTGTGAAYVLSDTATASITAKLIEQTTPASGPSYQQSVTLTRYKVDFTLSDGSGVPGVDVPLGFEGSLSSIIEVDSTVDISVVLVPAAAKLVDPLLSLGAAGAIQARATVTFYGKDLAGYDVRVTGDISVFFANYIDQ
jgi:hypothetical protein